MYHSMMGLKHSHMHARMLDRWGESFAGTPKWAHIHTGAHDTLYIYIYMYVCIHGLIVQTNGMSHSMIILNQTHIHTHIHA